MSHIMYNIIIIYVKAQSQAFLRDYVNTGIMHKIDFEVYRKKFMLTFKELLDGKSILTFSKTIGIPASTIYPWMKDATPSMEHLVVLAKHFDCSLDYLVGLRDY